TETIARLANGVKRFTLPDEHNFIKICEKVAKRGKSTYGEQARDILADEFENRRQYPGAAAAWSKAMDEYGKGTHNHREKRHNQIVKNWGRFEPNQVQPAGTKALVNFRFRNGKKVSFEAREIKVEALLDDVKKYLKNAGNNWVN